MYTAAIEHLRANDPILAEVIATHPAPTFSPHTDYYYELVTSIIGQQLSVKAAASITKRFTEFFDGFPTPEQIVASDIEALRSIGLSRPKASYIRDLAARIIDGTVRFDGLERLSNQEVIDKLTKVKGIGVWTVHMFLLFCMGRQNILPVGDLGIRNAIKTLYGLSEPPLPSEIEALAKKHRWHPYESIAAWYLWQSLDNTPNT